VKETKILATLFAFANTMHSLSVPIKLGPAHVHQTQLRLVEMHDGNSIHICSVIVFHRCSLQSESFLAFLIKMLLETPTHHLQ
jgi:hypothetical protein